MHQMHPTSPAAPQDGVDNNSSSSGNSLTSHQSPPPRSPPAMSLTTPPPRSATMTPGLHYATAPALSTLRGKCPQQQQPGNIRSGRDVGLLQTHSWLELSSSVSGALCTSVGVASVSVWRAAPSVEEGVAADAVPALRQPTAPTSAPSVAQRVDAMGGVVVAATPLSHSSTTLSWRSSWGRGWPVQTAPPRRPDDGSALSCDLPHLALNLHSPSHGTAGSSSSPALKPSAALMDSVVTTTAVTAGWTAAQSGATVLSAATRVSTPTMMATTQTLFSIPSPPSVSTAPQLPPSASTPQQQQQRSATSSPPLLPSWVYTISEYIGPQLPSPVAASREVSALDTAALVAATAAAAQVKSMGGEVASLRVDAGEWERHADGDGVAPQDHSSLSQWPTPSRLSARGFTDVSNSNSHPNEVQNLVSANDSFSLVRPAAPHEAALSPVSGADGRSSWNTTFSPRTLRSQRALAPLEERLTVMHATQPAAAAATDAEATRRTSSSRASLSAFFMSPRRNPDSALPGTGWRLERAVQPQLSPQPTGEAELTEEEHSRASLYAADQMSKSGSLSSLHPP